MSVVCGSVSACLRVTFPLSYPSQQPEVRYLEGTRLSAADRQHVKKAWELTAEQHVKRNRSCLEPCLRNLAASLQRLMERQEETAPSLYTVSRARCLTLSDSVSTVCRRPVTATSQRPLVDLFCV